MKIVADENIPQVERFFSAVGQVTTVNGRALSADQLVDADILLVRSVTRVDRQLLAGSRVKFVASATIGIDHLDTAYLNSAGIGYCNAPGCNADSVVDYVVSVLCTIEGALKTLLAGAQVGIIGFGNVGSRLYQRMQRLGVSCVVYDPLLASERCADFGSLEQVLAADIICCHAPLTTVGEHPSYHLLNAERLATLKQGAILISAGRGAVIDNAALLKVLKQRADLRVALDVWENEPVIDQALMAVVDLATPHIAGYSFDGKIAGTEMILSSCLEFLGLSAVGLSAVGMSAESEPVKVLAIDPLLALEDAIKQAVLSCYAVAEDDALLRKRLLAADDNMAATEFDQLRKQYPIRRELACYKIANAPELAPQLQGYLQAFGFEISA